MEDLEKDLKIQKEFLHLLDLRAERDKIRANQMTQTIIVWEIVVFIIVASQIAKAFNIISVTTHGILTLTVLILQIIILHIIKVKTDEKIKSNREFQRYNIK